MALTLRGASGELRAGYETAACLGAWELTRTDGGFIVSAPVIHRNLYWLTAGQPLDLHLVVGRHTWHWRAVLVSGDDPLTVEGEGRPEIR